MSANRLLLSLLNWQEKQQQAAIAGGDNRDDHEW